MLSNIPYEEMPEKIEELAGDVERLENNWNELKEWLENTIEQYGGWAKFRFESVYNKMQEIEKKQK